jgi:hypothetical protein
VTARIIVTARINEKRADAECLADSMGVVLPQRMGWSTREGNGSTGALPGKAAVGVGWGKVVDLVLGRLRVHAAGSRAFVRPT